MSELFREGLRRLEQEESRPKPGSLAEFAKLVRAIQEDSRRTGLERMTDREINAEVASARKTLRTRARASTKRSGK